MTSGIVECHCSAARTSARGQIRQDGSFQLETPGKGTGAVEGTHQVIVIQNTFPLGRAATHSRHDTVVRKVARRYARYESTPLTLNVSATQPNVGVILTVEQGR